MSHRKASPTSRNNGRFRPCPVCYRLLQCKTCFTNSRYPDYRFMLTPAECNRVLHLNAPVHDRDHTTALGDGRSLFTDNALLQPEHLGADLGSFPCDLRAIFAASEHIDDMDGLRYVLQRRITLLPRISAAPGLTRMMRYPRICIAADTIWDVRSGRSDRPTTAILPALRKISAISSRVGFSNAMVYDHLSIPLICVAEFPSILPIPHRRQAPSHDQNTAGTTSLRDARP